MTRGELLSVRLSRRTSVARVGEAGAPVLLFATPLAVGALGIGLALFGHPILGISIAAVSALGYYLLVSGALQRTSTLLPKASP